MFNPFVQRTDVAETPSPAPGRTAFGGAPATSERTVSSIAPAQASAVTREDGGGRLASGRAKDEGMQVSVMSLHGVVEELRSQGVDVQDVLRAAGVSDHSFADARTLMPLSLYERAIEIAQQRSKLPGLGLLVGSGGAADGMHQLMSHFAMAVPTLRQATDMLIRFNTLFVDDLRMFLTESAGVAYFRFTPHRGLSAESSRFCSEYVAAVCARIVRRVFSQGKGPLEVRFRHRMPAYEELYRSTFGCPVKFGDGENTLAFDAALLDQRQPFADGFVADMLRDACERMLVSAAPRASVASKVRMLLRRQTDLCRVDQDAVARELGLGRRMLRRRLSREGATMTALIDEARMEAARVELLRHGGSIKETAERLGYSEISAFHRAFRRWTGRTPADYVREERDKNNE